MPEPIRVLQPGEEPGTKPPYASATNIVAILAPILAVLLMQVGVPIPPETLVVLVSAIQSAVTLWARNRKSGGGQVNWRF